MFDVWLLAPLAAVAYLAMRTTRQAAPVSWTEVVVVSIIAALAALALEPAPGFSWSTASRLGKLAALVLAAGAPVLIAAATSRVLVRKGARPAVQGLGALVAGAALTLLAPVVGVVLACTFTGDCL